MQKEYALFISTDGELEMSFINYDFESGASLNGWIDWDTDLFDGELQNDECAVVEFTKNGNNAVRIFHLANWTLPTELNFFNYKEFFQEADLEILNVFLSDVLSYVVEPGVVLT